MASMPKSASKPLSFLRLFCPNSDIAVASMVELLVPPKAKTNSLFVGPGVV